MSAPISGPPPALAAGRNNRRPEPKTNHGARLGLSDAKLQFLDLGAGGEARRIAFRRRRAKRTVKAQPELVWLCGFKSDMASTKAQALDDHCRESGRALTRFDYSGQGASGGRFEDGTITRWLEETLAVIRAATKGPPRHILTLNRPGSGVRDRSAPRVLMTSDPMGAGHSIR